MNFILIHGKKPGTYRYFTLLPFIQSLIFIRIYSNSMIEQGETYTHHFSFTQDEVNHFAAITGDKNPVHLDEEYASKTMFKRPIMHGFLGGSIFSKVFGTLFPGEGTIYLKQSMAFMKPMYVNTDYEAIFTVKDVNKEKHRMTVETRIIEKESGAETITGEATVMNMTRI